MVRVLISRDQGGGAAGDGMPRHRRDLHGYVGDRQPRTLDFSLRRVRHLLTEATQRRILVLGDIMLDEFIWGFCEKNLARGARTRGAV